MKRITILLIMLLLVVACGPAGGTEETAVSPLSTQASEPVEEVAEPTADIEEETVAPESEPTDEPEPTEEPVEEVQEAEVSSVPANELVAAFVPATTAAEAAVIREQDWARGASAPDLIIIEYGDFQ